MVSGKEGNYGSQRMWGPLGRAIFGPIGGVLIDWQSGGFATKDYTFACVLVIVLLSVDSLLVTRFKVSMTLLPACWGSIP